MALGRIDVGEIRIFRNDYRHDRVEALVTLSTASRGGHSSLAAAEPF